MKKEKNTKQKLFEMMSKINGISLNENLNETGEMNKWDIEQDGEFYEWARELENGAKKLEELTNGKVEFIDIRPYDKYQGPYAYIKIDDRYDNLWGTDIQHIYYLSYSKLEGTIPELAEKINEITQNIPEENIQEEIEEFIPQGSYTISNAGGYEVMLNDSGDAARVRDAFGSDNPQTSDWLEIEYVPDEETGENEPVIDPNGYNIPLNQVMRIDSMHENIETGIVDGDPEDFKIMTEKLKEKIDSFFNEQRYDIIDTLYRLIVERKKTVSSKISEESNIYSEQQLKTDFNNYAKEQNLSRGIAKKLWFDIYKAWYTNQIHSNNDLMIIMNRMNENKSIDNSKKMLFEMEKKLNKK